MRKKQFATNKKNPGAPESTHALSCRNRRREKKNFQHDIRTKTTTHNKPYWLWLWRPFAVILLVLAMVAYWVPLPRELDKRIVEKETLFDNRGLLVISLPHYEPRRFYPIPIEDMGTWVPEMVVALEDHRFHQHHGVDIVTLGGSIIRNIRAGRRVSGGSTITQQVIKLAEKKFEDRTVPRKIYEMLAAMRLERRWSKMHILEEYLNRLPFGNGLLGVEAAAVFYFGKNTADLDQREAIFLAGLPQAPSKYNPWRNPQNAVQR
jgi:membrane peptidoglycan carboxypeptidase